VPSWRRGPQIDAHQMATDSTFRQLLEVKSRLYLLLHGRRGWVLLPYRYPSERLRAAGKSWLLLSAWLEPDPASDRASAKSLFFLSLMLNANSYLSSHFKLVHSSDYPAIRLYQVLPS